MRKNRRLQLKIFLGRFGWIQTKVVACDGKTATVETRILRWHPGFWLYALRYLWRNQ